MLYKASDVRVKKKDFTVEQVINYLKGDLWLSGGNIFDPEKATRIVEKLILGLPVPPFYVDMTGDEDMYVIGDDLTPLTIKEFCIHNSFVLEKPVFMREYGGMHFCGLPRSVQKKIESRLVVWYGIEQAPIEMLPFIAS